MFGCEKFLNLIKVMEYIYLPFIKCLLKKKPIDVQYFLCEDYLSNYALGRD